VTAGAGSLETQVTSAAPRDVGDVGRRRQDACACSIVIGAGTRETAMV
jgi:hypothetical protein